MSRGKKKPSLNDLHNIPISPSDFEEIQKELLSGSDRACAMTAGEMVNVALGYALVTKFVPLTIPDQKTLFSGPNAVLSSFSARIRIARCIGLFPSDIASIIETIRLVRNAFAHVIRPLDFDNPLIISECKKLADLKLGEGLQHALGATREKYVANCMTAMVLLLHASYEAIEKPTSFDVESFLVSRSLIERYFQSQDAPNPD